ncbi:MAG: chemotaxis protein CheA [Candidatus Koribacter versatilis]|uniref:Chemotaxis protein CheA n=1 Tax=Candidatus Korobacter versatilis TaxID=658062 RepID=A0A932A8J2_9BACT|nr:chemotaxis protein CheA [Candidatus Koribacter versatilis]
MSFFSEDKASELKEIFFESAQELLQTLNEEALALEKNPADAETVRSVRRTVHTLKGDSAACGYRELSELAHELEDVLTPELAQSAQNARIPEVVLAAADTFQSMLAAYRNNLQPPSGDALRQHVRKLTSAPAAPEQARLAPTFAWSEYEQVVIAHSLDKGNNIFHVALQIDRDCPMRAAAMQMIRNVVGDFGTVLAIHPEDNTPAEQIDVVEMAIASKHDEQWIAKKSHIPAVIKDVVVVRAGGAAETAPAKTVLEIADTLTQPVLTAVPAPAESKDEPAEKTASKSVVSENSLRVDADRIDDVLNLVGELIIGKSMLLQTMSEFDKRFAKDPLRGKFADAMAFQARVLTDLQKSVMKIRMVPVEQLFRRVPRVIRDVAKSAGKEVALQISGQDTDLDKSILDTLAEPLTHLVRNAVDHGLEAPQERVALGKPAAGTIRLNAFHQGNQVVIEVGDDGRGIDRAKVVAKAIERGIVTADEAGRMSEGEQFALIFNPGLSTAAQVTEVSGRGVGMDVVKTVLDRLKGSIIILSKVGEGTTFQLKVPLTLAIIKALLFRVADKLYAVPLGSVLEITRARESEIHRVDNHEVVQLRDQVLTLVRVAKLSKRKASPGKQLFIVIIAIGDRKFGLVVDRLIGEEELVIKALDDHLVATELVSGASILGDGTVVLILNVQAVVGRVGREGAKGAHA